MGGKLKLLFDRAQGKTEREKKTMAKIARCDLLEEQTMQLLVFRLGSHSRGAHPLARPGCQRGRVSPSVSPEHLSVPGDVAKAFPPAFHPCSCSSCSSPAVCGTTDTRSPRPSSPQKKGGGVIFSRLGGVILSSPCGPQTCWHVLLSQPGQGSSSGAG